MDKVMMNTAGSEPAARIDPRAADIQQLKSVLGQYLHDLDRSQEEKDRLRDRLHAAHTRDKLLALWPELTGQEL